jgi:uncharacterized membrane protein
MTWDSHPFESRVTVLFGLLLFLTSASWLVTCWVLDRVRELRRKVADLEDCLKRLDGKPPDVTP